MDGKRLLSILIDATGLPADTLEREINRLVEARGLTPDQVTLEDLRDILANYLQDALLEAKQSIR
ncbi:MAG: hypothetical protein HC902_06295 [Calothrix sp. SM1_5_4]|nr:hypothetical protein [Calothrix sp. SM1_5_4]